MFTAAAVVGLLLAIAVPIASAQTIQLTSCAASELSAAVATANSNGQDDTIFLKQNCTYTLSSQLTVSPDGGHKLSIFGYGNATISGEVVAQGANLTVRSLTLQGTSGFAVDSEGGGALTIASASITGRVSGALVYASGVTTVTNSSISGGSEGIDNYGGTLSVSGSTVSGNASAGIVNRRGRATVVTTTVSANGGGGIANIDGGHLRVFASTSSNNLGGGINNFDTSTAWIANTTVADNSSNNSGSGIFDGGQMTILWSTLSNNGAPQQAHGDLFVGSGTHTDVSVEGTIFARGASRGADCSGAPFHDLGYNLADDNTCALDPVKNSRANTSAGLDPNGLQNNSGSTKTIALMPGSAAIDFVPTSIGPPNQDQRLLPRPDAGEGFTDIGAFELQDG